MLAKIFFGIFFYIIGAFVFSLYERFINALGLDGILVVLIGYPLVMTIIVYIILLIQYLLGFSFF
jgi:hypothetical protein